jgi:hypothetical protein
MVLLEATRTPISNLLLQLEQVLRLEPAATIGFSQISTLFVDLLITSERSRKDN